MLLLRCGGVRPLSLALLLEPSVRERDRERAFIVRAGLVLGVVVIPDEGV
jgi:hypothetical protein